MQPKNRLTDVRYSFGKNAVKELLREEWRFFEIISSRTLAVEIVIIA